MDPQDKQVLNECWNIFVPQLPDELKEEPLIVVIRSLYVWNAEVARQMEGTRMTPEIAEKGFYNAVQSLYVFLRRASTLIPICEGFLKEHGTYRQ